MREILQEDPGKYVDLDELITALLELRNVDHVLFGNWYPTFEAKYYRNNKFYEGYLASKVDRDKLQHRVEELLSKHDRCAVSLWFNAHIVTGCFDVKV